MASTSPPNTSNLEVGDMAKAGEVTQSNTAKTNTMVSIGILPILGSILT